MGKTSAVFDGRNDRIKNVLIPAASFKILLFLTGIIGYVSQTNSNGVPPKFTAEIPRTQKRRRQEFIGLDHIFHGSGN
jgi:hypothetical protein